ncbi:MAG: 3-hydroxybutyryl-CoA dehydrogenase [Deltaproteobacteria bacterium]|nr:MAG: 3-hydroxybutyryl-CoA dehydrogenase [Deltaproteobacteria bacterium]
MTESIRRIGILGAGQMGSGIAQVAAQSGFDVQIVERTEAGVERGMARLRKAIDRLVAKERISSDEAASVVGRIATSTEPGVFSDCDLVVEAVTESPEVKHEVFRRLEEVCRPDAILATNTSSISITRIAGVTERPERVIGMHFMNPVPVMKLVEIIRGLATSDETCAKTTAVCERLGKTVVTASDYPGFIVNRVLIPMINEACYALMEGVGSARDIDQAMVLGTNQPMGPLTLADFIGLDTVLAIMEVLHAGLGDDKYRPCPLLRQHVDAGFLGRKAGRGFHTYN